MDKNLRILAGFILLLILALFLFSACGGVTGSDSVGLELNSRTIQSLRLGQTATINSPVAISAAIDNRESLVVLKSSDAEISTVLYRSITGEIARISINPDGSPLIVETSTSRTDFSNYTETTVDVSVTISGTEFPSETVPLEAEVIDLLGQFSSNARIARIIEDQVFLRQVLRSAIIAVRTFGCAGARLDRAHVDAKFASLTDGSCGSKLIDTISITVKKNQQLSDQIVEDLTAPETCNPNASFVEAENCAGEVGGNLVTKVLEETPVITSVVEDSVEEDAIAAGQNPKFDPTIPGLEPPALEPVINPLPPKPADSAPPKIPQPPKPGDPQPDNPN